MTINWNTKTTSSDEWESHPDLAEIIALQGRKEENECGGRGDDEGESSSELEEDNDRDADDDEDADGDDEDDTVKADRKALALNMFSVLGENECEWGMRSMFMHSSFFNYHCSLYDHLISICNVSIKGLYKVLNLNAMHLFCILMLIVYLYSPSYRQHTPNFTYFCWFCVLFSLSVPLYLPCFSFLIIRTLLKCFENLCTSCMQPFPFLSGQKECLYNQWLYNQCH